MTTDDELRELGKELPWDRPDASRREAVRSSLLVAAAEGSHARGARPWWIAGGGFVAGAAAAAVALVLLGGRAGRPVDPPTQPHASIEASAQANFERELTHTTTGTDEVVHLHAGKLRLSVGAVATGDHVRVRTGNAEVEGTGDVEVAVAADAIREVTVRIGTARVLVDGQQAVFLAAGDRWHAPLVTASIDPPANPPVDSPTTHHSDPSPHDAATIAPAIAAPVDAPAMVRPVPPHVTEAPARDDARPPLARAAPADPKVEASRAIEPADPRAATAGESVDNQPNEPATKAPRHAAIEHAFRAGYALLRAGKADEAATQLAAAADLDPGDPLAADARYLEATALVKAHRPAEAERALLAFLDHAGRSLRRGRASVMLARLIADRGDASSARRWFEAALQSADPEVAAAARAGLATLP